MSSDTEIVPIEPEELVQEVRRLRERIPKYQQLTVKQARSMVRGANLNFEFVSAGLSAAGAYDGTKSIVGWTEEELRQQLEEAARWTAVEDELTAMVRGVGAANLNRRYIVGRAVLMLYAALRSLVRRAEFADLIPFVATMK